MKKAAGSLKLIEKRERRIEKKTQWILWIVIAILIILGLFYLQSYYLGTSIFLTGKAGVEGGPEPGRDNDPNTGSGGGGTPSYIIAAENAASTAENAADSVDEISSKLNTFTSVSESNKFIEEINIFLEEAKSALNAIDKALEENVGSKYYEREREKIIKIIDEIERTKKNIEDFKIAKEEEKALILKKIDNRIKTRDNLKENLKDKIPSIEEQEQVLKEGISFTQTTTQGIATATYQGEPTGSVEWMIKVENIQILDSESGNSIKINLPHSPKAGTIRFPDTGSASLYYLDARPFLNRLLRIGKEKPQISISNPKEGESYEIRYETDGPTFTTVFEEGKITVHIESEINYENVFVEFLLPPEEKFPEVSSALKAILTNDESQPIEFKVHENFIGEKEVQFIIPETGETEQTMTIIVIKDALHLDSERELHHNIYKDVFTLDDIWSEIIPNNEYVRVTFEIPLTNENDITIYPRTISGDPIIEVYEEDGTEVIVTFQGLEDYEYNKVFLTNLEGEQDTFDLLVLNGALQFDHIIDPTGDEEPGFIPSEEEDDLTDNGGPTDAYCGDGDINQDWEECDDGNGNGNDDCIQCQNAFCGDGFTWDDLSTCLPLQTCEVCDDGNDIDDDECTNSCEIGPGEPEADSDEDGISDPEDNCPNDYNPDQQDSDGDGIGDVCDNTPFGPEDPSGPADDGSYTQGDLPPSNEPTIYNIEGSSGTIFGEGEYAQIALYELDEIVFSTESGQHTIVINDITIDLGVTLTITSEPQQATIPSGGIETFDLGDLTTVVAIKVEDILLEEDEEKAFLIIAIIERDTLNLGPTINAITKNEANKARVSFEENISSKTLLFIFGLVAVLFIAYIIFHIIRKANEEGQ